MTSSWFFLSTLEILSFLLHLNRRWARNRGNCSPVRWTWTALAGLWTEYNKTQRWLGNQHIAMWRVLINTQRQARKFILGPSSTAKTRKLSFNKLQSTVVTDLSVGHNTLRRHLYIMELTDIPLCRTFLEHRRKPQSMFCMSVKPWLHTHTPIWVPFLGPRGSEKSNSGSSLGL